MKEVSVNRFSFLSCLSVRRVRSLCVNGEVRCRKIGARDWLIAEADAKKIRERPADLRKNKNLNGAKVAEMRSNGLSITDMQKELKCSRRTVCRLIEKEGLTNTSIAKVGRRKQ